MNRYAKNGILTKQEMLLLKKAHICVVGCGGLGGYIMEMLSRIGIGKITIIDGDVFDETNLNRQLLSLTHNLGQYKVEVARARIKSVNPEVKINMHKVYINKENANRLIDDATLVIDALDSIEIRKILQNACESMDVPLIHGAIAGWYGQVTTIFPGDKTLDRLYTTNKDKGIETDLGNPSFTPATVASIQVSEAIKVLINKKRTAEKQNSLYRFVR